MLVVSVVLLTAWLGALTLHSNNSFIHLLALTAILAVLVRRSPRERRTVVLVRTREPRI
jgi:hypothetical protein